MGSSPTSWGRCIMASTLDIGRVVRATRYSYAGLKEAVLHQAAFRQELILGLALIPLAIALSDSGVELAMLLGSLLLVLIVELLNSAIEIVVDRIGTEPNELSRRAKDLGSAAVFITLLNVPLVWGLVLFG